MKKNKIDIFRKNFKKKPYNHKLSEAPTTQTLKELFEENSGFHIFSKNIE